MSISFDLAWSMESGEHMHDKRTFVNELARVTAPDGRIIIVTWCHRELKDGEKCLPAHEQRLLDRISRAYFLPAWVPTSQYVQCASQAGLEGIKSDDWTEFIRPFWGSVVRSALAPKNLGRLLFGTSKSTIKGALAATWMRRGTLFLLTESKVYSSSSSLKRFFRLASISLFYIIHSP